MEYRNEGPPSGGPRRRRGSTAGYFLSSLIGLLVGALLVALILPRIGLMESRLAAGTENAPTAQEQSTAQPVLNTVDEEPDAENTSLTLAEGLDVPSVVEQVGGAAVGITNIQTRQGNGMFGTPQNEDGVPVGTGSGVIYKKEGDLAYIVTNNHVVTGSNQLEITLADGTDVEGTLVGTDIWTDLAVVTMDASEADTIIEFGDSSSLRLGQPVIAIGNPLGLEFAGSVTTGVVSGLERVVPVDVNGDATPDFQSEAIQTDAAINPGNSGGALLDASGKLIGINSMKISTETVEGIGLAIPIDTAIPIIEQLEVNGEVHRPTLGVTLVDLSAIPSAYHQSELGLPASVTAGAIVQRVLPNSAASQAGLRSRDVITAVDGQPINGSSELRQYLFTEKKVGEELQLTVYRGSQERQITLSLTDNLQV
ncbi:S1C family serine protease [Saccharibacillus kuerlensis]|uniref:Serine protease n=1 Tax=Saccharibacillus kuerlensis TaxID=459527 RepID=A0ABQ2L3X3_9BACL|nr:trypsin-like peptidase domain-containing protein [Saccharibacillus kuerlensis]GGO01331.1 serine protease [Saccharibacillus kuerlensis]